jgi:hypothetical protein
LFGNFHLHFCLIYAPILHLQSLLCFSPLLFHFNHPNHFQIPVALFACFCPFMASGTGLGLLFFFGVRYGSILGLTPFLILAIGVDDAFLMIHSWQLASARRRKLTTKEGGEDIDSRIVSQLTEVRKEMGIITFFKYILVCRFWKTPGQPF